MCLAGVFPGGRRIERVIMVRKSFKTDVSFLEKLSIGATGTRKVLEKLTQQGHMPIELERGSTGYKIWKSIKIKRVRVPDILYTQLSDINCTI